VWVVLVPEGRSSDEGFACLSVRPVVDEGSGCGCLQGGRGPGVGGTRGGGVVLFSGPVPGSVVVFLFFSYVCLVPFSLIIFAFLLVVLCPCVKLHYLSSLAQRSVVGLFRCGFVLMWRSFFWLFVFCFVVWFGGCLCFMFWLFFFLLLCLFIRIWLHASFSFCRFDSFATSGGFMGLGCLGRWRCVGRTGAADDF